MLPLIGITCGFNAPEDRAFLARQYIRAVEAAGGLPVLIGPVDADLFFPLASRLGGLLLPGGGDVDPVHFGQEPQRGLGSVAAVQDALELGLTLRMKEMGKPVLGICRGAQVINVALGGTLYQDIGDQVDGALKHFQDAPRPYPTHGIEVEEGTRLAALLGPGGRRVNSFHHQAVARPAPGLTVSAFAADGVVEGIEDEEGRFLGVQCHPEWLWEQEPCFLALFRWLVQRSGEIR
ncbi:MAG: gamma-glutamyl-gamma-aminobutyrate hydrolase family protein [Peptococcaceae bacterium]|jgi:putative glutamine amidotransferase|nr:gamma-glutamyl-gamma-aminobutyrate hydrolase family protein [Peptococcaceae bacterium]